MIIRSIKLADFLSHRNTEVELCDGINALVGPNGAGKSSIIEALYITLFPSTHTGIRGGRKELLLHRGSRRSQVSVVFEVGGRMFRAVRYVNVGLSDEVRLYELINGEGRLRATGFESVRSEVAELMGVRSSETVGDLVKNTIISLQDELTRILELNPSDRREEILKLFGLDYLVNSLEVVKSVCSKKQAVLASERMDREQRLQRLRDEEEGLRAEVLKLQRDYDVKQRELSELKKAIGELELKRTRLSEALKLIDLIEQALAYRRLKELENELNYLSQLNEWDPLKLKDLVVKVRDLGEEIDGCRRRVENYLSNASTNLGISITNLMELNDVANSIALRLEGIARNIARVESLIELYEVYLNKVGEAKACPICGSSINDPMAIRDKLAIEIAALSSELRELRAEEKELLSKRSYLVNALNELRALINYEEAASRILSKYVEELRKEEEEALSLCRRLNLDSSDLSKCCGMLEELKNKLVRVKAEYDSLKTEFELREPLHTSLDELVAKLASYVKDLGVSLDHSLASINKQWVLETRSKLMNALRAIEEELRNSNVKLSDLSTRLGEVKGMLERVRLRISELSNELAELRRELDELRVKEKAVSILLSFSNKYLGKNGELAKALTTEARRVLEELTNDVLRHFRLGVNSIKIGGDFNLSYVINGEELPIRNASGGEKVSIAIALRLALAEMLMERAPTTIILDEPTTYLDEENKEKLFKVLKNVANNLRQVIVVTHDEKIMEIADKVFLVENEGGVSYVRSI
ncbi:MAG: SMC family ATPase [Desulfurococcaceae archaeon]|nr:SMC family ATPase [Sulfolobales archaeon]MDW8170664.1 SMC family ATPase [Desulfurococcaceae archaeon]